MQYMDATINDSIALIPARGICVPRHKDLNFLRRSDRFSNRETIVLAEWRVCNTSSPIRYPDSASRERSQNRN